jgi:hypothetical protein
MIALGTMINRILQVGASLFVLCTIALSQVHPVAATGNTIKDLDFHSPFDNTYDLGKPFLVEYDNTTSVQAGGANKSYDLQAVFSGYGILNGTSYTDVGVSSIDYRTDGSVVYQNGSIALTTEAGEKATLIFESLGKRDIPTRIVYDHGIIFFSTNSTTGELASLNNTVAVYKDVIDDRTGNLTTIAWEWK